MVTNKLGFTLSSKAIREQIYVPKYYDPTIAATLKRLESSVRFMQFGDLIDAGHISVHYGHDIGKHTYGLGRIPYVRTSDVATWEVVSAPKQTVGMRTYEKYAEKQDVRAGDVLVVRDGLYLIGRAALVTAADLPLIHQSHLLRFRSAPTSEVDGPLLLALLNTPIALRQIRSKQFTAGIIDKLEDRYRELLLPVPRTAAMAATVSKKVCSIVARRVELREQLKSIPHFAQGLIGEIAAPPLENDTVGRTDETRLGFLQQSHSVTENIYIPKYYDPSVTRTLVNMAKEYNLLSVAELVRREWITLSTGIEVGKLAYGLGDVPFIRTSDLANWELAGEPKHRVSRDLYDGLRSRVDLRPEDILLVRDGTYLVGTSAILTHSDAEALYAGGLYRIRSLRPDKLDPYLLLALLNMPVVKRQMRSKQFTRDIIDTLGKRLLEVVIPCPKSAEKAGQVASATRAIVEERVRLRDEAKNLVLSLEGETVLDDDEERELAAHLPL